MQDPRVCPKAGRHDRSHLTRLERGEPFPDPFDLPHVGAPLDLRHTLAPPLPVPMCPVQGHDKCVETHGRHWGTLMTASGEVGRPSLGRIKYRRTFQSKLFAERECQSAAARI